MCGATVGILRPRKFTLIEGLGRGGGPGSHTAAVTQTCLQRAPWERRPGLAGGSARWEEDPERQPAKDSLPASCIKHSPAFSDAFSEIFSHAVWRLTFALQPQNGERKPELCNTEG